MVYFSLAVIASFLALPATLAHPGPAIQPRAISDPAEFFCLRNFYWKDLQICAEAARKCVESDPELHHFALSDKKKLKKLAECMGKALTAEEERPDAKKERPDAEKKRPDAKKESPDAKKECSAGQTFDEGACKWQGIKEYCSNKYPTLLLKDCDDEFARCWAKNCSQDDQQRF
ncbi:hypothetical protein CDD83_5909 [Cordyceps sp. RAO-2017]|nr:hypothetical protein CDD83_5909 [Cordyceps sp. RAO-2017]